MDIHKAWDAWKDASTFSGVFAASDEGGMRFTRCCGFRNRSEGLACTQDTSFAIASGTKLLTALAVCKLIDAGALSLHDKLCDILHCDIGRIDRRVTIFHLLTHTSGIGDYIDEEAEDAMAQLAALYAQHPVQQWESLAYYLPMITNLPAKFAPGARFGYSNAGYVLLGLSIEAISGLPYQQYVAQEIIALLGLIHTGFYRTDALPANTALGYMDDVASGTWRTNTFHLPIIGGSDGGLYTCALDLDTLWRALFAGHILSENMLALFVSPHVKRDDHRYYGLGVYAYDMGPVTAYYALGSDFGVDFFSAYFPKEGIVASALCNTECNTYPLLHSLF